MHEPDLHGASLFFNPRLASVREVELLFDITTRNVNSYEFESFLDRTLGLLNISIAIFLSE